MRHRIMLGRPHFKQIMIALAIGGAVLPGARAADSGTARPVQDAHDTYCIACHDTSVYTRDARLADDYKSLREQVVRWQGAVALNWSDEEINRMTAWLATHYYRIPCPEQC